MRFFGSKNSASATAASADDSSRKHQRYLNPEVSQDGLVTCELVAGAVPQDSAGTNGQHGPTRASNMMMHGEALVWMDKDHPRGTMVIGGSHTHSAKHKKKKDVTTKVYGGGTLPPGWEHLNSLRRPVSQAPTLGAGPEIWGYKAGNEESPVTANAPPPDGASEAHADATGGGALPAAGGGSGVATARVNAAGDSGAAAPGAEGASKYDANLSPEERQRAEELYLLAESAHHSGNFEDGANYYEDVLSLDPYHKLALAGFAMLMRMLGRLEEAESLYLQAITIDPCFPDALCGYGLLLRTIDRHEEAESMYVRSLQLDPYHVNTLCSYGAFMHTLKNQPDEAERMYLRALKIDPHHVDSICNYAALKHVVRKDLASAELLYRMGLEENPDHVGILYNFSSLLEETGQNDERAQQMYEKAMKLIHLHSPGMIDSEEGSQTSESEAVSDASDVEERQGLHAVPAVAGAHPDDGTRNLPEALGRVTLQDSRQDVPHAAYSGGLETGFA